MNYLLRPIKSKPKRQFLLDYLEGLNVNNMIAKSSFKSSPIYVADLFISVWRKESFRNDVTF